MTTQCEDAKRYCRSLGLDPHEAVEGVMDGVRFYQVRWQWYLGARAGQ